MSIFKRLKNLWKFSLYLRDGKLEIYADDVLTTRKSILPKSVDPLLDMFYADRHPINPRPQATIIKLKPKDEVEQILKENAD